MKRMIKTAVLGSALALVVSGCKFTAIEDGKIPAGYEQFASQAVGTYTGHIQTNATIKTNMRLMTLDVAFTDGRMVLTPSIDWIKDGCNSKIGNLLSVQTSGTTLSSATFAFDGGSCKTPRMGDRLVIRSFKQSSGHPKLVAWVQTDWTTSTDQDGEHTSYVESQADLQKQ